MKTAITVLLTALASGCLVVPLPTPRGNILEGTEVKQSQLAFLQQSVTTKEEVIQHLGTPTIYWRDENIFVYRWFELKGLLLWAAAGGYSAEAGTIDITSEYAFLIKFDTSNRFETSEVLQKKGSRSFGQFLLDWRDAQRTRRTVNSEQAH